MEKEKYLNGMLDNVGIYELRELARRVGVASPTTKTRNVLVEEIEKVLNGEQPKPLHVVSSASTGRPPKKMEDFDALFDLIVPKAIRDMAPQIQESATFTFGSDDESTRPQNKTVSGVCRIIEGAVYFHDTSTLSSPRVVSAPSQVVELYNLEEGDRIVGEAKVLRGRGFCVLTDIFSINNNLKLENRKKIDFSAIVKSNEIINIAAQKVNEGTRAVFYSPSTTEFAQKLAKELCSLKNQGYVPILLATNVSPENLSALRSALSDTSFITQYEDTLFVCEQNITDAIISAKALARSGKKVVFVAFELEQIVQSLNLYHASNGAHFFQGHTIKAIETVKAMFSLARCLDNGGSITTVVSCSTPLRDDVLKTELEKLSFKMFNF
ncbi:MAG: hypothetical protein RR140_01370 [Clostridia bacterium]